MKPRLPIEITPEAYTILIVDDYPNNLQVAVHCLQDYAFRVITASTGEDALSRTAHWQPDLILLDVVMPGMDGFETCRRLKTQDDTKDIPVIFMTALTDVADKVKGFEVGGVDYITKPFQPEDVLARIGTHLYIRQLTRNLQQQAAELQETNHALEQSVDALHAAQEQLVQSEKMTALGNMVASIAHELNTPVGISITAASHLEQKMQELRALYDQNRLTRTALDSYVTTAEEASIMILKNLQRVAEQIQSFKQVVVDQVSSEKRTFHLKAYIHEILLSLRPTLRSTRHTVTVHCPEELEIASYPGTYAQILTNLIMNTLTHGFEDGERGEILLTVTHEAQRLRLQYSDNGSGMPPEEQKRIFEPFYTTKRGQGGTGLGMFIVYNLVTQQLQGKIECRSAPHEGVTFVIDVPLYVSSEGGVGPLSFPPETKNPPSSAPNMAATSGFDHNAQVPPVQRST